MSKYGKTLSVSKEEHAKIRLIANTLVKRGCGKLRKSEPHVTDTEVVGFLCADILKEDPR